jgi:hypothetical protein
METLGEDLALLSVGPNGRVQHAQRLAIALAGSELVRLAAHGKADVADGRIVVRDAARTGSAELDLALESLVQARRPPKARAWVGRPRRGIVEAYLDRLAESGALRSERAFLGSRWRIADPGRAAAAAARLDAIARSSGAVDTASAAFGGLAHAAGVDLILYRGLASREPRARLRRIAQGKAAGATAQAADAASRAAGHAATEAAVSASAAAAAASDAAAQAAIDAATQAAIHASTQAAVHAAVHAATQAADAGGHGGAAGHHGH